jgi:hypothetical protein
MKHSGRRRGHLLWRCRAFAMTTCSALSGDNSGGWGWDTRCCSSHPGSLWGPPWVPTTTGVPSAVSNGGQPRASWIDKYSHAGSQNPRFAAVCFDTTSTAACSLGCSESHSTQPPSPGKAATHQLWWGACRRGRRCSRRLRCSACTGFHIAAPMCCKARHLTVVRCCT